MHLKPELLHVFLTVDRLKEHLQISESIGPKSLNSLIRWGLEKRFPDECGIWTKEVNAIKSACRKDMEAKQKEAQDQLNKVRTQTDSSIRLAVVNAVFSDYPFVLTPFLWCPADEQMYSTLDRSRYFTSVALTADEESSLSGEPLYQ